MQLCGLRMPHRRTFCPYAVLAKSGAVDAGRSLVGSLVDDPLRAESTVPVLTFNCRTTFRLPRPCRRRGFPAPARFPEVRRVGMTPIQNELRVSEREGDPPSSSAVFLRSNLSRTKITTQSTHAINRRLLGPATLYLQRMITSVTSRTPAELGNPSSLRLRRDMGCRHCPRVTVAATEELKSLNGDPAECDRPCTCGSSINPERRVAFAKCPLS